MYKLIWTILMFVRIFQANSKIHKFCILKKKNALYLNVNVFKISVRNEDTILTSPLETGLPIYLRPLRKV